MVMSLCATGRAVRRTWTVELRPQHGGPLMACPHCPPASRPSPLGTAGVRTTVVSHLANHARHDALPVHLRTCQCHEHGCQWHPRHRGCSGPIALVLTCERGGRLWRLTDACTACARATAHSAVVPETVLRAPTKLSLPSSRKRRRRRARGPEAPVRVQEMLSYLAAALSPATGARARLLAVQCALRAADAGRLWMPAGLLNGMRMGSDFVPWRELEQAQWLCRMPTRATSSARPGVVAQLLDATVLAQAPGRCDRARAADWALRLTSRSSLRAMPAPSQLVALALAAHLSPSGVCGSVEADRLAYECAMAPGALTAVLDSLVAVGAAASWAYDPVTEDITWAPPPLPAARVRQECLEHPTDWGAKNGESLNATN